MGRRNAMADQASHVADIRSRLKAGKLSDDDKSFIDGLLALAERQGLGERAGERRVVARLPHGMDIVK
jgi:hypothetical protein